MNLRSVRLADNPFFRKNSRDILVRRYVEGRIKDGGFRQRRRYSLNGTHFVMISLLNGNLFPLVQGQVEGRNRGGDVKGNAVFLRQIDTP